MLDSNLDEQLSALGRVPTDLQALVRRVLGSDQSFALSEIDVALASLSAGGDFPAPPHPQSDRSSLHVGGAAASASRAAAAASAIPPSFTPAPLTESPLVASAASAFDSRPPPRSAAPAAFDPRSAPPEPGSDLSTVFGEKPDADSTAQAIVAAFDDPEGDAAPELDDAPDTLASLVGVVRGVAPHHAFGATSGRSGRRDELRGSRRPDLDELLDQPLDALDFERTEPVRDDESTEAQSSNALTGLPPPPASGDDFEILVDDEILEIAEDDVEMVDDESSN